jgi:precorrin-3B methylase
MSPELRNALWEYLDRLVHLSAQAMFSNSTATDEMNRLSRAVVGASMAGQGKSAVELSGDPSVQKAADDLICRIR